MSVPLAEVGRRGRMDLTFVLQSGETVLRDAYCEIPFKITRVLDSHRPLAHLVLMQCTAGLFGGDHVESSIRVERGARVLLTQQSATKVHPSQGKPAIQKSHIVVADGGELQLYLEPVIPFSNSFLQQTTLIDVEPGARFALWEPLMAGRVGRGERWQFGELATETHLRSNQQSVYLERFRLPNALETSAWGMRECNYLATGLYVGEHADDFALKLHDALPDAGVDTLTPGFAVARVVSASGPEFHRCREVFCRHAATALSHPYFGYPVFR